MKKLVVKTVAITLSIVIGLMAIAFGIICWISPNLIANAFNNLGSYSASKYFYEIQYEQTNEIDDLVVLLEHAYGNSNQDVEEYLAKIITHEKFNEYCNAKNTNLTAGQMRAEEYFSSYYATILIANNKFGGAIKFSKSYVATMGYTEYNPFRAIVNEKKGVLTANQLAGLKQELEGYLSLSGEQKTFVEQDLNKLG